MDRIIRDFVRRWTSLPHDTPVAYIHASVADGGLRIYALRTLGPLLRIERLTDLQLPGFDGDVSATVFMAKELDNASRRLNMTGTTIRSRKDMEAYWRARLSGMCDGYGLREAGRVPESHRWVREPTRFLSGRDYIMSLKTRINALPSKSRTSRGRDAIDRHCRAGCNVPETTNHIVQQCFRTHNSRIARHNSVATYISRNLSNAGYKTTEENQLRATAGILKPDIIAIKGDTALVLDAQIITDSVDLDAADSTKTNKYANEPVFNVIRQSHSAIKNIRVLGITMNWRGVWSQRSATGLIGSKVIRKNELALLSTRTLIGTVAAFRTFSNTTMVRRRTGVG